MAEKDKPLVWLHGEVKNPAGSHRYVSKKIDTL